MNRLMELGDGVTVFRSPCARRKEKGKANGAASAIGQARGGFKARLRRQDIHGAWPARQKAGDEWRTRGVKTLRRSATATERFSETLRFRLDERDCQRHFNASTLLIRGSFAKIVYMTIVGLSFLYHFASRTIP